MLEEISILGEPDRNSLCCSKEKRHVLKKYRLILPIYKKAFSATVSIYSITRGVILSSWLTEQINCSIPLVKSHLNASLENLQLGSTTYSCFFVLFWSYSRNITGEGKAFRLMDLYLPAPLQGLKKPWQQSKYWHPSTKEIFKDDPYSIPSVKFSGNYKDYF